MNKLFGFNDSWWNLFVVYRFFFFLILKNITFYKIDAMTFVVR